MGRRQEWRAQLRLTGDEKTDRANREEMLDTLHASLVRGQQATSAMRRREPIQVEAVVGEPIPEIEAAAEKDPA